MESAGTQPLQTNDPPKRPGAESERRDGRVHNSFRISLRETGFKNAPIKSQNRCRIVRIVRDIERLDKIQAEEPVLLGDRSEAKQQHIRLFASLEDAS